MKLCRTYWGTHGCRLPRGHKGGAEGHECECCECDDHEANPYDADGVLCVGKFPYYGDDTWFYGEDAKGIETP